MTIFDGLGIVVLLVLIVILAYFLNSASWITYYSVTIYGYGRLLAKYHYESYWNGESFFFKKVCLDSKYINYEGLSTVINSEAIYVHRLWDKDTDGVLIPWTEVSLSSTSRYKNSYGLSLSIGNPQIAKLYLPGIVVKRIEKYLPAYLLNGSLYK